MHIFLVNSFVPDTSIAKSLNSLNHSPKVDQRTVPDPYSMNFFLVYFSQFFWLILSTHHRATAQDSAKNGKSAVKLMSRQLNRLVLAVHQLCVPSLNNFEHACRWQITVVARRWISVMKLTYFHDAASCRNNDGAGPWSLRKSDQTMVLNEEHDEDGGTNWQISGNYLHIRSNGEGCCWRPFQVFAIVWAR